MTKLNTLAVFDVLFLSVVLIGSGIYSSTQIFVNAEKNEAEVKADIKEQENKCKKDTECENENKINNKLSITNITQVQGQVKTPCEDCFKNILNDVELEKYLGSFSTIVEQEISTLQELCDYINENQGTDELNIALKIAADASGIVTYEKFLEIISCLQDAEIDVADTRL